MHSLKWRKIFHLLIIYDLQFVIKDGMICISGNFVEPDKNYNGEILHNYFKNRGYFHLPLYYTP